jgi:diguanylate cyclase (GGDEF)-like protein
MWRESEFSFKNWRNVCRQVIACRESRQFSVARQYFIAAGVFIIAFAVRILVMPVESGLAFLTFYPGTALAALFCSMWPSLFYVLLAATTGAYVFIHPYWAFSQDAIVPTVAFIVAASSIFFIIHFYQCVIALQLRAQTYIASHDGLTKLPNRIVFHDRLCQAIALAQREQHTLAVLLIDLDNFKTINDTLGHDVGDLLLKDVSQRLLGSSRDADTVARLGGDEFAALLYNIDSLEVSTVCRRIAEALGQSFHIEENNLFVTASIGISLFPNDGSDECTLLKNADAAMYHAKSQGKNRYQYFADEIKQAVLRHHALEAGLRLAQQKHLFSLHYQPKISIADGTLVGAEALIRWSDPELGAVSPVEFIPVAEKAGLIGAIGCFVVSRVIEDIIEWYSAGLAPPPIAVNISPSSLSDLLHGLIEHQL